MAAEDIIFGAKTCLLVGVIWVHRAPDFNAEVAASLHELRQFHAFLLVLILHLTNRPHLSNFGIAFEAAAAHLKSLINYSQALWHVHLEQCPTHPKSPLQASSRSPTLLWIPNYFRMNMSTGPSWMGRHTPAQVLSPYPGDVENSSDWYLTSC